MNSTSKLNSFRKHLLPKWKISENSIRENFNGLINKNIIYTLFS